MTPRLLIITTVSNMLRGFLLPFAAHFRAKGWAVDALASGVTRESACMSAFDRVWDIGWSRNPLVPANYMRAVDRVLAVCRAGRYDLVHVHTPVAGLVTRWALRSERGRGLRVIYTAHGFHFFEGSPRLPGLVFRRMERLAARWTDYLIVINEMDHEAALSLRMLPPSRVVRMPGIGLDTQRRYHPESVPKGAIETVRRELGLAAHETLILMVAEFNTGKRHTDALSALAKLPSTYHLAFAGEGRLQEAIEQKARGLRVAGRVHFLGRRGDVPVLIRASTCTLLTSAREGLPRSVMESMSLGVPVVATDIRGNRDLLNGGAGVLVPVGDVDAIAHAVSWVCENPEFAQMLSKKARERIPEYDIQHILLLHERLYERALAAEAAGEQVVAAC